MKNQLKISKYLQLLVLLTFFLPFFPLGCKPKQAVKAPVCDSSFVAVDSAATDSVNALALNGNCMNADTMDQSVAEEFVSHSDLLTVILFPGGNFSGIGYLVEVSTTFLFEFGVVLAFVLWILALVVKLRDFNSIFYVNNVLALAAFSFANPNVSNQLFGDGKLWGYWVCFGVCVVMLVLDTLILLKKRNARIKGRNEL